MLVSAEEYKEFNMRPQRLIAKFISRNLDVSRETNKEGNPLSPEKPQMNDVPIERAAKRRRKDTD